MDKKGLLCVFLCWATFYQSSAQDTLPAPEVRFTTTAEGNGLRFHPQYPPLIQVAGAPPAFYTSYWEFGDGHFSFEESPWHAYAQEGEYEVILCGTANYDDNKKPPKPTKKKVTATAYASAPPSPVGTFTAAEQSIALRTNRQPMAGQELFCIVSYRNRSAYTTGGRLHLFYNERHFPKSHFQFLEARTHYGEVSEAVYSTISQPAVLDWEAWTAIPVSAGGSSTAWTCVSPSPGVEDLLQKARRGFRNEQAWRFSELRPGETRNLFVTLLGTPDMLKDTHALILLMGVFAPFDPAVPADSFLLEIEIVNSHDPNSIAVSDSRMNFRWAKKRSLEYRVRFQNTGEGPAKKVEITVSTPKSLDMRRVEPIDWYPRCPICTDPPQPGGCLDTAITNKGLVFTFHNIYLPGTRQKNCFDKDSTKGFVRYRIRTAPRLAKLPFSSQASIVFDRNEPVITNYATTRFKPGLSPGIKVGYGFHPDSISQSGYYFVGVSLSPYRSWRTYAQAELLTGVQVRTELPETVITIPGDTSALMNQIDTLVSQRILTRGYRQAFSVEVPVLLRRNLNGFLGVGLGGSLMLWMSKGEDEVFLTTIQQPYRVIFIPGTDFKELVPIGNPIVQQTQETKPYQQTLFVPSLFGDITLGSVRAGPHLGLRAGWRHTERWTPFAQVALHVTF